MIIGIKATQIGPGGGMTHLVQMLKWFPLLAPEDRFVVYGHAGQEELLGSLGSGVTLRLYKTPARGLVGRILWERTKLPGLVLTDRCNLLFEPGNYVTPRLSCPSVILIHNLAPFVPEYVRTETPYQQVRLNLLRQQTLSAIRSAAGVIYLSHYARQTITAQSGHQAQHETVIYHGATGDRERPGAMMAPASAIPSDYILCVSHIYRYKGILEMVEGYADAVRSGTDLPPLLVAGALYDRKYTAKVTELIARHRMENRIRLIGPISESELPGLYRRSTLFVFPSKIENCPNILLEAMKEGCTIACSGIGVMPELCGDAASYFDPSHPETISACLRELFLKPARREELSILARKRAQHFNWESTARRTLDFLHCVREKGSCATGRTGKGSAHFAGHTELV